MTTLKDIGEAHLRKIEGKPAKKTRKPKEPIRGFITKIIYAPSYGLDFTLSAMPPLVNGGYGKSHWAVQAGDRKRWRLAVKETVFFAKPSRPLRKATLRFVRHSATRPDSDGLVTSFKSVRDGLMDAGIILDDKYEVIGMPQYDWAYAKNGTGHVTVEVRGVDL